MARISISVPPKLMARLEPIREGINISQLCRDALEQRAAAYERAASRNAAEPDLEHLVRRLRDERELVEGRFEQLGADNAAAWLRTASYIEVKTAAEEAKPANMRRYKLPHAAHRVMERDMTRVNLDCEGPQAVGYKTAWLDYVRAVWAKVIGPVEQADQPEAFANADEGGP